MEEVRLVSQTLPWLPLLVATNGSSAISWPKTRSIAADTTNELCNIKREICNDIL